MITRRLLPGRCFNAAGLQGEYPERDALGARDELASMGRGLVPRIMRATGKKYRLQFTLQWGRGGEDRDLGALPDSHLGVLRASMGPRWRRDRGSRLAGRCSSPRSSCFNGAAVTRPRDRERFASILLSTTCVKLRQKECPTRSGLRIRSREALRRASRIGAADRTHNRRAVAACPAVAFARTAPSAV